MSSGERGARLRAEVVVVGGGPSGLVAAHCLGAWGIRTVLLEQRTRPVTHPRATLVNVRTMEVLRLLDMADAVRAEGVPLESSARISWMTTLAGAEIGCLDVIESASRLMRVTAQSPVLPAICPQHRLEAILASALRNQASVHALHGCEGVAIDAHERAGVRVRYRDADGTYGSVQARYAILAEGLNGWLREQAGIATAVDQPLGRLLDIYFTADLRQWTAGRESALYWVLNMNVRGVLITVDPGSGEWLLEIPDHGDGRAGLPGPPGSDRACAALTEAAVGASVSTRIRSVRTWSMGSTSAVDWRDPTGRVFVVGDAAHTFPPTGGFGMNTGVQDAHNLSWKLAGVLRGWAAPGLLDSYELERRPVADFNARQSERNAISTRDLLYDQGNRHLGALDDPGPAGDKARAALAPLIEAQRPHFDFQGQALGFRYPWPRPSAAPVVRDIVTYRPQAVAGARAPHGWLDGPSGRVATGDLSGRRFALLTSDGEQGWAAAVRRVRAATTAPIGTYVINGRGSARGRAAGAPPMAYRDAAGKVRRAFGLGGRTAVLIRPDGHVVDRLPGLAPEQELRHVLGELGIGAPTSDEALPGGVR